VLVQYFCEKFKPRKLTTDTRFRCNQSRLHIVGVVSTVKCGWKVQIFASLFIKSHHFELLRSGRYVWRKTILVYLVAAQTSIADENIVVMIVTDLVCKWLTLRSQFFYACHNFRDLSALSKVGLFKLINIALPKRSFKPLWAFFTNLFLTTQANSFSRG